MLPISQINPNIKRGPKNSEEFIQMCEDIHYDITKVFSLANDQRQAIEYNMNALVVENYFLQSKIKEIEAELEAAKSNLNSVKSGQSVRTLCNTLRTQTDLVQSESTAQIDVIHGLATIPYTVVSKGSIIDYSGQIYIPPTLKIDVYESTAGIDGPYTQINDPNATRSFDCSNSSIWMHTSAYPYSSSVEDIYIQLYIKLPLQSINNAYVNCISLKPFPEYSLEIIDIQYITPSQSPSTIPNFPPQPIQQAGRTLFMFPQTEITELIITLRQPYYFVENNMKYFYYGMQEIGIYYYDFKTDSAYIATRFALKDRYFSIINTPRVVVPKGCSEAITGLVSHELFFPSGENEVLRVGDILPGSSTVDFGDEITDDHTVAYVLTRIERTEGVVPAISEIQIDYIAK